MTTPRDHSRAVGALIITSLFWSLGGVLIKYIAWPPLAVGGGRGIIAAIFLLLVVRPLRFTWSWPQIGAAVAYTACTVLFVGATKLTTAANAILLQYTAPIYVALLGFWFLGERTTRKDWITIAVALGGMTLFFADGLQLSHVLGNLLAVASGVGFAVLSILLRKQKDGSAAESIILGNLLAGAIGLSSIIHAPPLPVSGWLALVTLGVLQLGFSYYLYARAIRHVSALEGVLIPVLEPVLNPVWTMLAFGERPSFWSLIGGTIVLGAVIWRALSSIRRTRATELALAT